MFMILAWTLWCVLIDRTLATFYQSVGMQDIILEVWPRLSLNWDACTCFWQGTQNSSGRLRRNQHLRMMALDVRAFCWMKASSHGWYSIRAARNPLRFADEGSRRSWYPRNETYENQEVHPPARQLHPPSKAEVLDSDSDSVYFYVIRLRLRLRLWFSEDSDSDSDFFFGKTQNLAKTQHVFDPQLFHAPGTRRGLRQEREVRETAGACWAVHVLYGESGISSQSWMPKTPSHHDALASCSDFPRRKKALQMLSTPANSDDCFRAWKTAEVNHRQELLNLSSEIVAALHASPNQSRDKCVPIDQRQGDKSDFCRFDDRIELRCERNV
jgi:hypothetical protein